MPVAGGVRYPRLPMLDWVREEPVLVTLLLVFLASRLTGGRQKVVGLFAGAQGVVVAVDATMQIMDRLTLSLVLAVPAIGFAGLTAAA